MSEAKLKEAAKRGQDAERVLKNPIYNEAYLVIKADQISKFESTKYDQQNERDEIWRKLQALNWVQQEMERIMRNGEVAQKTLLEKIKDKFTGP